MNPHTTAGPLVIYKNRNNPSVQGKRQQISVWSNKRKAIHPGLGFGKPGIKTVGLFRSCVQMDKESEDAPLAVSVCFVSLFSMTHNGFLEEKNKTLLLNLLGQINALELLVTRQSSFLLPPCASLVGPQHLPVYLSQTKTINILQKGSVQIVQEDSRPVQVSWIHCRSNLQLWYWGKLFPDLS